MNIIIIGKKSKNGRSVYLIFLSLPFLSLPFQRFYSLSWLNLDYRLAYDYSVGWIFLNWISNQGCDVDVWSCSSKNLLLLYSTYFKCENYRHNVWPQHQCLVLKLLKPMFNIRHFVPWTAMLRSLKFFKSRFFESRFFENCMTLKKALF